MSDPDDLISSVRIPDGFVRMAMDDGGSSIVPLDPSDPAAVMTAQELTDKVNAAREKMMREYQNKVLHGITMKAAGETVRTAGEGGTGLFQQQKSTLKSNPQDQVTTRGRGLTLNPNARANATGGVTGNPVLDAIENLRKEQREETNKLRARIHELERQVRILKGTIPQTRTPGRLKGKSE